MDAASGNLLGFVDVQNLEPAPGANTSRRRARAPRPKENPGVGGAGAVRAGEVLAKARSITAISDREGDDFHDFANRCPKTSIFSRASSTTGKSRPANRGKGYELLSRHVAGLPEAARFTIDVPAAPGRAARKAKLALRFAPVTIKAPTSGMRAQERRALPPTVRLHVVEAREIEAPEGVEPLRWLLLTSWPEVADPAKARMIVRFYRMRWIIEEYFRTLKTAGFPMKDR